MAGLNKFFLDNRFFDSSLVYLPSSEEAQLPAEHLRDQLAQAIWQTQGPWVITEHNRYIDFNRAGVKVATIALGTYTTGTLMAAAVVAALVAADGGPTWACDYNVAAANKFRIRDSGGVPANFILLWNTGANKYRSVGICMGFDVSADTANTTTHTAANVSYQSRHFLVVHQSDGSAIDADHAILFQHNLTIFGAPATRSEATLQGNATNAWSAPTFSESWDLNVVPTPDPALLTFSASQSFEFYRFILDDVQNPDGFNYVGIVYLGEAFGPSVCCSESLAFTQEDFSQLADSISGAGFTSGEPDRENFPIEYSDIPDGGSDESTIDLLCSQPVGVNFFFQFDDTDPQTLWYVAKVGGRQKQCVAGGLYWTYQIPLAERI
jgi:hypothetical protein